MKYLDLTNIGLLRLHTRITKEDYEYMISSFVDEGMTSAGKVPVVAGSC